MQRLALQARPLLQYDVENCQIAGASTTPGLPIPPLKGHSAEWGAGAGEMIMIIIIIRIIDDDDDYDDDDAVADEAAVFQGRVSQHLDWKSKAAEEGDLRKVAGEIKF